MAQSLMCSNSGGEVRVPGAEGEHLPIGSLGPKGGGDQKLGGGSGQKFLGIYDVPRVIVLSFTSFTNSPNLYINS